MKKTLLKENKRVVNKRYWNKEIDALIKIENEQSEDLAFSFLINFILPEYLKELGFSYSNENKYYELQGVRFMVDMEGIYADLKFYGEGVSKKISISNILTTISPMQISFSYKEQIKQKRIFGDLNTLASEILISIREIWNFSHPNLCFSDYLYFNKE
jgi:hypothetical protein